jgi:CDP-L-myo-inositol myo-inositolphosphotransferase
MHNIKRAASEKKLDKYINQYKIFDYYIYARVAKIITRPVLKTSLTPNQITLISLFFGIAAGFLFLLGGYYYLILGAIFMQLVQVFDTVDGAIARFKNLSTNFGGFFDFSVNMITGYIAISTIALGLFFKTSDTLVLIFGLLAVGNFLMMHMLRNSFYLKLPSIKPANEYQVSKKLCIGGADTFTFLILVCSLFNQLLLLLVVLAIGSGIIWIKRMFCFYKLSKGTE